VTRHQPADCLPAAIRKAGRTASRLARRDGGGAPCSSIPGVTVTLLHSSYVNFEHGGRLGADYCGNGGAFDFSGLVRIMSTGPWPAVLGIGEADRWDFNGYEGAYGATAALRAAGGPAYVPVVGSLPREAGPFAPAILYDPQVIQVHRWYDHRLPDAAGRTRNLLLASLPGSSEMFRVIVWHGDIHDGDMRLADAKTFDRFANPDTPCVILADWNATLSGPWNVGDFNDSQVHDSFRRAHKIVFHHGPRQAGLYEADTRALDYLCGFWLEGDGGPGRRVGGIGFFDIAELEADFSPTQLPTASGRKPRTIDHALVNKAWRDAYVPGSYRVHPPVDPERPDSDHLRISFAIQP
jgi:hypothetical protein